MSNCGLLHVRLLAFRLDIVEFLILKRNLPKLIELMGQLGRQILRLILSLPFNPSQTIGKSDESVEDGRVSLFTPVASTMDRLLAELYDLG